MVTLVETKPWELDVPVGELRVAAFAGVTVHVTPAPEMVLVPVASVTLATRGEPRACPGLALTGLELETWTWPATPGATRSPNGGADWKYAKGWTVGSVGAEGIVDVYHCK